MNRGGELFRRRQEELDDQKTIKGLWIKTGLLRKLPSEPVKVMTAEEYPDWRDEKTDHDWRDGKLKSLSRWLDKKADRENQPWNFGGEYADGDDV